MRVSIDIDDNLMVEAMKVSGLRTKREAVEAGLRLLVQLKRQQRIRAYRQATLGGRPQAHAACRMIDMESSVLAAFSPYPF